MNIYYNQEYIDKLKEQIEEAIKTYADAEFKVSLGKVGELELFLVNESFIDKHIEQEFCEGGNNGRWKFVPEGEIWLDISQAHDYKYIGFHEAIEYYLMTKFNLEYEEAHKLASEEEHKYRQE
jgi:hypothetical protein